MTLLIASAHFVRALVASAFKIALRATPRRMHNMCRLSPTFSVSASSLGIVGGSRIRGTFPIVAGPSASTVTTVQTTLAEDPMQHLLLTRHSAPWSSNRVNRPMSCRYRVGKTLLSIISFFSASNGQLQASDIDANAAADNSCCAIGQSAIAHSLLIVAVPVRRRKSLPDDQQGTPGKL
jgi:hypothetical protein